MQPESIPILGVALALASAAVLSVGNILQSRGVRAMTAGAVPKGVIAQFWQLVRNRFWLIGGLLLGLSILFQLASLAFAPLMVVQPIGVTALVFTVLITSIAAKQRPAAAVVRAITICVLGVASFVTVAAIVSTQHAITGRELGAVLVVLAAVLLATAVIFLFSRKRTVPAIMWVVLGGVYSGFVVTLGKTVILRVQAILDSGMFAMDLANILTILCVVGIAVAGGLSIYFVQLAHATSRAEVVVAGLTVIDPAVAVIFSITILAEASNAPPIAMVAFAVAGAVAVAGVFALSRAEAEAPPSELEAGGAVAAAPADAAAPHEGGTPEAREA